MIKMAIRWLPVRKPWNSPWKISHSLTKPLSGDPEGAGEGDDGAARQAVDQAAEPVHVPGSRRVLDDAGL
jgi:hypothetical protein